MNLVQADDYLHEMSNIDFSENHKVEITKFAVCCIYDWHFLVNFNKDFIKVNYFSICLYIYRSNIHV